MGWCLCEWMGEWVNGWMGGWVMGGWVRGVVSKEIAVKNSENKKTN